jgi:ElaB/YqjD/DUF883 family membrane-anchored ribosome-binding protein
VERTSQGTFVVTTDEIRVLRQGLFVTLHHGDAEIQHDVHTITGHDLDEFRRSMWSVDELNGHNDDETREQLRSQLAELAAFPTHVLEQRSQRVREVVDAAERYGPDVPWSLR